jgi:hypothetical protein
MDNTPSRHVDRHTALLSAIADAERVEPNAAVLATLRRDYILIELRPILWRQVRFHGRNIY